MSREQNRLTNVINYDINNLIFKKDYESVVPKSNPPIKSRIVPLATRNIDGSVGDLLIRTENELFSFGIAENKSLETGKIIGYSLPLCTWNMDSPTENERKWTSKIEEIVIKIRQYLDSHPEMFFNPENKLYMKSPLYWKIEKGKRVEGKGPIIYPKLMATKSDDRMNIQTIFYSSSGDIDPMTLLKQRCRVTAVLKFESIRIAANSVTLQVKLYEAKIKLLNNTIRRMMEDDEPQASVPQQRNMLSLVPEEPQVESKNTYDSLKQETDEEDDSDDENLKTPNSKKVEPSSPPPAPRKAGRIIQAKKK